MKEALYPLVCPACSCGCHTPSSRCQHCLANAPCCSSCHVQIWQAGAAFHAADVQAESSVAVIGCGGIGLNAIQGARIRGAETIIGVDVVERKLEEARLVGATHVVNAAGVDVVQRVLELTGGVGVDYSFEAIGRPECIEQAYAMTGKAGKCVVVGIAPFEAKGSIDVNQLVYSEKTLTGSLYGTARPRKRNRERSVTAAALTPGDTVSCM